jgi:hypothetical protein
MKKGADTMNIDTQPRAATPRAQVNMSQSAPSRGVGHALRNVYAGGQQLPTDMQALLDLIH